MKGNLRNTKRVPPYNNRIVEVAGARKKCQGSYMVKIKIKKAKFRRPYDNGTILMIRYQCPDINDLISTFGYQGLDNEIKDDILTGNR